MPHNYLTLNDKLRGKNISVARVMRKKEREEKKEEKEERETECVCHPVLASGLFNKTTQQAATLNTGDNGDQAGSCICRNGQ